MEDTSEQFELSYNLALIKVKKLDLRGQEVYTIDFSNEIPTLTASCTTKPGGERIWNSIPEGCQELAGEIGKLIEDHYAKIKT
jgi:hypothetical protein